MRARRFALTLPLLLAAAPQPDYAEPYRLLQRANLTLDAELATSAYAKNATLAFDYPGRPPEAFQGREAIRSSYLRTFRQVDPGMPIRIRFRFERPGLASDRQAGVYRIDAIADGRPITVYGRFSVRLVREGTSWRFAQDRGMPAVADDFDMLPAFEELQ